MRGNDQQRNGGRNAPRNPRDDCRMLERIPPVDTDAERAILGSVILAPDVMDELATTLGEDDFFDDSHRRMFRALKAIRDNHGDADVVQLVHHLKAVGDFEACGGAAYIYRVGQSVPNAAHWKHYARIVRDLSARRNLILASTETIRDGYEDTETDPSDLIAQAESRLGRVSDQYIRATGEAPSIRQTLTAALERIDHRQNHECDGIRTGFPELDRLTSGLHRTELTVVGARPSQGKSAALCQLGMGAAQDNAKVLFVTLEMSQEELTERMVSVKSGVNGWKIRGGTCNHEERNRIIAASASLSQLPIWFQDDYSLSVSQIAAFARRHRRKYGLDVLLIDYCQLIRPENPREQRHEQVAGISRALKGIAREIDIAVVVAAQVNRQAAEGEKPPKLHNLRESGAIEQDADVVFFCHIPDAYDPKKMPEGDGASEAQWILDKQRNGPRGTISMWFRRSCTRWEEPARTEWAPAAQTPPRIPEFDNYGQQDLPGMTEQEQF